MERKFGWLGKEFEQKAFSEVKSQFIPFVMQGETRDKPGVPIWRLMRRVNNGKNLITFNQETGDCCSMGAKHVLEYLQAALITVHGKPMKFKRIFAPFIYGMSRTAPECGNGSLGRSAGSTGAWTAAACKKYGACFDDDPGIPAYSGRLADTWGYSGVPEQFIKEASDNLVKGITKLNSVDELRTSLINYYPATIASSWGFAVDKKDGCKVYVPSGSWAHQMCFIAWQDDPFPAAFRLNSWGENSTGKPLNDEPGGGAWQPAESIEKEISSGVAEIYGYSSFDGFFAPGGNALI